MKKITGLAFVGMFLAVSVYGSTNVFNDAVFWFRGGKDSVTADGQLQTGEFFDDLHANDASHANHTLPVYGYPENAIFRTESVVFPALGNDCAKSMQVLNFSDNKHVSNDLATTNRCPAAVNPYKIFSANSISNEFTVVFRLRLDSQSTMYLLRAGYRGWLQNGFLLGFKKDTSHDGCVLMTAYRTENSSGTNTGVDFPNVFLPTNTWIDVGVVVGNGKLRIGAAVPASLSARGNNPAIVFQQRNMWTDNCILTAKDYYSLFGESLYSAETTSASTSTFKGSVQQVAIWKRVLSDQEVMAAFGMPRPAIFKTGLDNGGSDEFGGTRSGASQAIDGLGSWQGITDTMLAGDTWTVNFEALQGEAGLPQIFSVRSLPSSASASLQISINGTSLGTRYVGPNGCAFWPVASNVVVQRSNTATIRRADGGSGVFRMDAMELGGSFGVGVRDQNNSDMVAPARISTGVSSAADPNPQHWAKHLQTYDSISNVHFRVWVEPGELASLPRRLKFRTGCTNRGSEERYRIRGDETFSLLVNGIEKDSGDSLTSWAEHTIEFAAGDLNEGWNDVELKAAPYGTCYWKIDYYRFETFLSKGFSIPPSGFILSFK